MQKHKEWATETVLFVAWCIISWHHLLTARDMFLFSVWSLHWCCYGFAPKTCKPTGLKALNCPVLGIGGPPFDRMSNFVYPMPAESLQIYTQRHQSEPLYEDHILLHFCSLFRIRESSKFEMTKTLHPCIDFVWLMVNSKKLMCCYIVYKGSWSKEHVWQQQSEHAAACWAL